MPLTDASRWTSDAILAFVAGKRVTMRDQTARQVPLPDWLAEHCARVVEQGSGESIDSTHPDDRNVLIDLYLDSHQGPGEVFTTRLRIKKHGIWRHVEVQALNLQDDDRVGGILFASQAVDGPPVEEASENHQGDHRPTAWLTWTLDPAGQVDSVAGDPARLLGYEADELKGVNPSTLVHPDSRGDSVRLWIDIHDNLDTPHSSRRQWRRKDGSWIWIEASYICRSSWPEGEAQVFVIMMDITERREAELALRENQAESRRLAEDFRVLADGIDDAVFRCDADGAVTFSNARWTELVAEHEGGLPRVSDLFDPGEAEQLADLLRTLAHSQDDVDERVSFVGRAGATTWQLDLRRSSSDAAEAASVIGTLTDVTDYVALQRSASTDALTGLANRSIVERSLREDLRQGRNTTVAFIDLDGFKQINDSYGHDAGDAALIEVARRLAAVVRPTDTVARWGGDEFLVLFRDADPVAAPDLVKRLQEVSETPIDTGYSLWKPRFSIGCASAATGDNADEVIAKADQAMYRDKRRNHTAAAAEQPTWW